MDRIWVSWDLIGYLGNNMWFRTIIGNHLPLFLTMLDCALIMIHKTFLIITYFDIKSLLSTSVLLLSVCCILCQVCCKVLHTCSTSIPKVLGVKLVLILCQLWKQLKEYRRCFLSFSIEHNLIRVLSVYGHGSCWLSSNPRSTFLFRK